MHVYYVFKILIYQAIQFMATSKKSVQNTTEPDQTAHPLLPQQTRTEQDQNAENQ